MKSEGTLAATLDQLARLVDRSQSGPSVSDELRDRSRARCLSLAQAIGSDDAGRALAVIAFASELFCAAAVDFAAHPAAAERFIEQFERITGLGRVALGREVLRWPQLPMLVTDVAIEVQLALLRAFTQRPRRFVVGAVAKRRAQMRLTRRFPRPPVPLRLASPQSRCCNARGPTSYSSAPRSGSVSTAGRTNLRR